jgi:poly-gamma-glutamate synthesis protein (capsule biosynthesis protein)
MGIENNHVADLGPVGRTATEQGLQAQELVPLTMERSPVFQAVGTHTVGIVPFTRIAGQDGKTQPLDLELEQRLDLARQLSDASIAFVHWGLEYTTWPSERQYVEAQTLASFGADVIVGSHPHVVQTPACVAGIPVFFSLGNHVFDQKYPVSKLGMLAKCDWSQGLLHCAGVRTSTGPDDISPVVTSEVVDVPCDASARDSLEFEGTQVRAQVPCAVSGPVREITLELKRAGEVVAVLPPKVIHRVLSMHLKEGVPASLVVLEDHFSKFDNKVAPRPYVYAVKERGLVAQWRGTTLAYPTVDLSVVHSQEGDVLCALHKRESPLLGALDGPALTTVAYVWDSFGFRGSKDDRSQQLCKARYAKNVNAS